jgi:hypothetical protein
VETRLYFGTSRLRAAGAVAICIGFAAASCAKTNSTDANGPGGPTSNTGGARSQKDAGKSGGGTHPDGVGGGTDTGSAGGTGTGGATGGAPGTKTDVGRSVDGGRLACGAATCNSHDICATYGGAGGPQECFVPLDSGLCPVGTEPTNACGNISGTGCVPESQGPTCIVAKATCADGCGCLPASVCNSPLYHCGSFDGRNLSCASSAQ